MEHFNAEDFNDCPRSPIASSDDGKQDDEDDWLEGTSMGPAGGGASRKKTKGPGDMKGKKSSKKGAKNKKKK